MELGILTHCTISGDELGSIHHPMDVTLAKVSYSHSYINDASASVSGMKTWTLAVIASLCLLADCAARTPEQQTRHDDAKYATALSPYERDLKPGVSRKEVEDYLRARNIPFGHASCNSHPHPTSSTFDDEIELRTENRPWPCGTAYVSIVFVFTAQQSHPYISRTDDMDVLEGIHIAKFVDCV